jgi:hypothetical protein
VQALLTRRELRALLVGGCLLLALMACSGERRTFGSTQREAIPTNVIGKSDTSGISAGAALQAPGSGPAGAAPTQTPTLTPPPGK